MSDTYISGTIVGKRIDDFIKQKCESRTWKACTKSLWKIIRETVPTQKTGEGFASRYDYHEESLGDVMYNWYENEYPEIVKRANKTANKRKEGKS